MEAIVVGIDVSKDRLDVHVHPAGDCFVVSRNAEGLDALIARIVPLGAKAVAVEATGRFETVVAASLGAAGLPPTGKSSRSLSAPLASSLNR
jgi:transposase